MFKSSGMMPLVEHRLRNLSKLVEDYQVHVLDLIQFGCTSPDAKVKEHVLIKTFVSVFKGLKKKSNKLPAHMLVYSNAIKEILREKYSHRQVVPSIKNIDKDVNIEEFNPDSFKNINIFLIMENLPPKERIILCMATRHKLLLEEIATLFSTTSGTISSTLLRSKKELAKRIILSSEKNKQARGSEYKETGDCFFIKNNAHKKGWGAAAQKHTSKCEYCRNFYGWINKIDELITHKEKPVIEKSINAHIFAYLDRIPLQNRIIKLSVLVIFAALIFSVFISHYRPQKNISMQYTNTINEQVQEAAKKKLAYKITIVVPDPKSWGETNRNVKKTLAAYHLKKATDIELGVENQKGSYYHFLIPKDELAPLIESIKTVIKPEIKEEEEITEVPPNEVRLEVWVNKHGV